MQICQTSTESDTLMLTLFRIDFEPTGNIFSYKFTETASSFSDSGEMLSNVLYDQDWALIRVQPPLHRANVFQIPGDSIETSIKGFIRNEELDHGSVHVISAISGVCEGYLSPSSAYWMFERSIFEVRTVLLSKELSNFSWETFWLGS